MLAALGLTSRRWRCTRLRTLLGVALVGVMVGSGAAPVRAAAPDVAPQPAGLTLRWNAPAECPDRERMLALVSDTLGEVDPQELRPVDVRGDLVPDSAQGYRLELILDDGRAGQRELRGPSCEELSEAAALVIAMAIDPRLLERGPREVELPGPVEVEVEVPPEPTDSGAEEEPEYVAEAEPAESATPEPPTPEPIAETPAPEDQPPPPRARRSMVGHVHAGVGGGPLPGVSGVVDLAVGLAGSRWRVELGADYWTPRTTTSPANPAVGARAQLWAMQLSGCGEPRWRDLSVPLCAGVLVGAMRAEGTGDLAARQVATRWVAAMVEPGLVWWLGDRWGLGIRARGHAPLARPELRSEPSGTIFVGSAVGGSLRAGVELRLP